MSKNVEKSTIVVEQRHIDEARHNEADNGRQAGTDPISRAVLEFVKANDIKHDRAMIYRKPGPSRLAGTGGGDLWLCINQHEEVRLPAECAHFMNMFDKRLDERPARPFVFQVRLP